MSPERFQSITSVYPNLSVAVLGDFCLDRYLEIDPAKSEVSIETGLAVYNVVNVRAQPGGAGTIVNNLSALGIGTILPIGFAGDDGEGYELQYSLKMRSGVRMDGFVQASQRRTFSYCKPLVLNPNKPPLELNRLDSKNWTPTPSSLEQQLIEKLHEIADQVEAIIILDQVDMPGTGVVTSKVLAAVNELVTANPELVVIADSRQGLLNFPPVIFKMNASELAAMRGVKKELSLEEIKEAASVLALENQRSIFVTLAERGILGAGSTGRIEYIPAIPPRGDIDVVGAGDSVTANLTTALVSRADLREALELANAAASVVLHKLGTTGTASIGEIEPLLVQ